MINQLYTLLLNLPASDSLELIDPQFSPNTLSENQLSIRNQVFPFGSSPEYISFIAKGVVRLCESSSLWQLFLDQDLRQPFFSKDISAFDLIRSMSISVDPRFVQTADRYFTVPKVNALPTPEDNFIVSQEYIYNPLGTTTIGAYGVYIGSPQSGIFKSSWNVKKEGSVIKINNIQDPTNKIEVPINSSSEGSGVNVSSHLPGEQQMFIRIFGPSIPDGFNCIIKASNPMSYSYQDLYSRLATSNAINAILAVNDQSLAQTLSSFFWSPKTLHDSIAAAMIGYTYSF